MAGSERLRNFILFFKSAYLFVCVNVIKLIWKLTPWCLNSHKGIWKVGMKITQDTSLLLQQQSQCHVLNEIYGALEILEWFLIPSLIILIEFEALKKRDAFQAGISTKF